MSSPPINLPEFLVGNFANGTQVTYRRNRTWVRNGKRRDIPSPYTAYRSILLPSKSPYPGIPTGYFVGTDNTRAYQYLISPPSGLVVKALDKCYGKFIEDVKGGLQGQLAVSLAEANQSIVMIATRVNQLRDAVRALKRNDFHTLASLFKFDKKHKVFGHGKDLSKIWLELHFGWVPLLHDISDAIDSLQAPLPRARIRAKAQAKDTYIEGSPLAYNSWARSTDVLVGYTMGAEVSVENPNLYLANQMGFVNPLSVAWELIPFSFLVDWFVPVSNFLNSFTDLYGVSVLNPFTTKFVRTSGWESYLDRSAPPSVFTDFWSTEHVMMQRTLGITRPVLGFRNFQRLSVSRAATSVSLLLADLKSVPRK